MRLNPRLELAARFCGGKSRCGQSGCGRLIEIGCDHARLSAAVVLGGAAGALACDLRPGPLSRAAKTAAMYGLEQKIELRLSDGLEKIAPHEGDTIAMCGMGGELIAGILQRAPWAMAGSHRLVLQPQSKPAVLRRFLAAQGVGITREGLARDGRHIYVVLEAAGGRPVRRENMYLFTDFLQSDPLFALYLGGLIESRRKIIAGRAASGRDCAEHLEILEMLEKHRNAT